MTKRLSSKLLSVILALAICATTVFGCLMTVSADTSWITFGAGESTDIELTKASIELTVTLGDLAGFTTVENDTTIGGMMAGEVALSYGDNLTLTGVTATGGDKVDANYTFDAKEFEGNGYVDFDSNGFGFLALNNDDVYYERLTFKLDFELASAAENGDKMSVTASSAVIAGGLFDATYEENTSATGIIVAGCDHKLVGSGTLLYTDTVNGYAVYSDSVCTGKCGNSFGPQVVPTKLPGKTLYWDGSTVTAPTKTDNNGNTLITSAAELAYITSNNVTGSYKVADGIGAIVLQSDTYGEGIMALTDYVETQAYFAKITPAVWKNGGTFQGTFDGNGVTIYGMYSTGDRGGLFGTVYESTVIKNVSVKNSYIAATKSAGALAGYYTASNAYLSKEITSTSETNPGTWTFGELINLGSNRPGDYWTLVADNSTGMLTFDKCVVSGCYINSDAANSVYNSTGAGVWLGVGYSCLNLTASNMLVHDNQALANNIEQGITGLLSTKHTIPSTNNPLNNTNIENCIILDCVPYTVYGSELNNQAYMPADFTNVYTDTEITFNPCTNSGGVERYDGIINKIDASDLKGNTAKATEIVGTFNTANNETVWAIDVNRGYPKFKQAETPDLVSDTSDYELTLIGTNITYNNGGDYNYNFYYRPGETYTSENISLYVAQLNDKDVNTDGATLGSFHHLTGEVLSAEAAAAVDVRELQEGDIRFTIERLSAREIYNTLLATAVAVKDGEAFWGETDEFSIADYENAIINGAYDTDDKNLAEAVLKYGRASATALNTKNDAASGTTIYWNGSKAAKFYGDDDGRTADDPIIINTAEEFAFVATATQADTKDRYFKMANGISKVVLQNEEQGKKIIELDSADAVKDYFEGELEKSNSTFTRWVGNSWNATVTCFSGNFDGNGVEFYGMYNTNGDANSYYGTANSSGGLFYITDGAVISNVSVKNSYTKITGTGSHTWQFGLIVSYGKDPTNDADGGANNIATYLNTNIDRCTIANNYIYKQVEDNSLHFVGTVCGNNSDASFIMTNCLLYGNIAKGYLTTAKKEYDLPIIGGYSYNTPKIENSIILDNALLATYEDGTLYKKWSTLDCFSKSNSFKNVYTNWDLNSITDISVDTNNGFEVAYFRANGGYEITESQAMGIGAVANMPNLDWADTWCYGSTYPSLAKGAYKSSSGKTLYWDGTTGDEGVNSLADNGESGTADSPIIIDTAEELAVITGGASPTQNGAYNRDTHRGLYYELADDIDKIILQPKEAIDAAGGPGELLSMTDPDEVKQYLSTLEGAKQWSQNGGVWFNSHFDGKGVEIYGLYAVGMQNPGLFATAEGGGAVTKAAGTPEDSDKWYTSGSVTMYVADSSNFADCTTVSGVTLKNSYLQSATSANQRVGGIIGTTYGTGGGACVDGTIKLESCGVVNCWIGGYNQSVSGILSAGTGSQDRLDANNCFVYGNEAYLIDADGNPTTTKLGLFGSISDQYTGAVDVSTHTYNKNLEGAAVNYATVSNTVSLGTAPLGSTYASSYSNGTQITFTNVYTDATDIITYDGSSYKITVAGSAARLSKVTNFNLLTNTSSYVGDAGTAIVNTLNTANGGKTVWYTNDYTYFSFTKPSEMLPSAQIAYDAITFETADTYGENNKTFGVYATSLNLKTNPYISFAFAFSGEYKSNRDKIKVTFGYTVDGTPTTKEVWVADSNGLLDGWSNASNDRFHIYRFQDIPVEALTSPITVTVAYNGTEKVTTGTFSVEGFGLELLNAYKQAPSNYYETRIEAVKALLFYTQMLQARYGAQ